jgi:hypothetical protein
MSRGGKAARRPVVEEVAIAQKPKTISCEAIAQLKQPLIRVTNILLMNPS